MDSDENPTTFGNEENQGETNSPCDIVYTNDLLCAEETECDHASGYNELECSIYQNYTAPEVFVQGLAGMVNQQDVEAMIRAQKKM